LRFCPIKFSVPLGVQELEVQPHFEVRKLGAPELEVPELEVPELEVGRNHRMRKGPPKIIISPICVSAG